MNQNEQAALEHRLDPLEPPYRTAEDAQIGRMLDRYGIPFFYEQPRIVQDDGRHRIQRPGFTLPWYNGLVIEYAGDPQQSEAADNLDRLRQLYVANGIPAVFVGPAGLIGSGWEDNLYERIQRAGEQSVRATAVYHDPGGHDG